MQLDQFTEGYLMCALWASMDGSDQNTGGSPMDKNYCVQDIAPESLEAMVRDCRSFQEAQAGLLETWYTDAGESPERAGHDFWLTRNRHGSGYWDRWSGGTPHKVGLRLTEAAHVYGSADLYVGDDGRIYQA